MNWGQLGGLGVSSIVARLRPPSKNNDYTAYEGDITVHGTVTVNEDIVLNGKSLTELLESIQLRLSILNTNPDLESEWEDLKQLGDKYRNLESEILEKEKLWKILNN